MLLRPSTEDEMENPYVNVKGGDFKYEPRKALPTGSVKDEDASAIEKETNTSAPDVKDKTSSETSTRDENQIERTKAEDVKSSGRAINDAEESSTLGSAAGHSKREQEPIVSNSRNDENRSVARSARSTRSRARHRGDGSVSRRGGHHRSRHRGDGSVSSRRTHSRSRARGDGSVSSRRHGHSRHRSDGSVSTRRTHSRHRYRGDSSIVSRRRTPVSSPRHFGDGSIVSQRSRSRRPGPIDMPPMNIEVVQREKSSLHDPDAQLKENNLNARAEDTDLKAGPLQNASESNDSGDSDDLEAWLCGCCLGDSEDDKDSVSKANTETEDKELADDRNDTPTGNREQVDDRINKEIVVPQIEDRESSPFLADNVANVSKVYDDSGNQLQLVEDVDGMSYISEVGGTRRRGRRRRDSGRITASKSSKSPKSQTVENRKSMKTGGERESSSGIGSGATDPEGTNSKSKTRSKSQSGKKSWKFKNPLSTPKSHNDIGVPTSIHVNNALVSHVPPAREEYDIHSTYGRTVDGGLADGTMHNMAMIARPTSPLSGASATTGTFTYNEQRAHDQQSGTGATEFKCSCGSWECISISFK